MIVLFDLNGTLTDPAPIGEALGAAGLGDVVLERAVRSAFVDALTGVHRPFATHVRGAVAVEARRRGLGRPAIDEAVERASALPARPGAGAALSLLAGHGLRLAVLTNSGAESGRGTLEANGLAGHFEAILGVDAVRSVKPHPSAYRHAVEALDTDGSSVTLAAAHDWDITGAKRAGLRTAFVDHGDVGLSPVAEPPDLRASSLEELASRMTKRDG